MLNKRLHSKLWLYFSGIVFAAVMVAFLVVSGFWALLSGFGTIPVDPHIRHLPVFMFLIGSILLGILLAVFVGKLIIKPVQRISSAFDALSAGDFSVRVPEQEKITEIREMAQRFNSMVYDLSHVETLRNDFVVNVSHEFKTPLSAIEGYATLLQESSMSAEKHQYYVEKILDNSHRLSTLSSNILLLSKLENQEVILHRKEYRLDEQLRKAVLALENKWTEKEIGFDIEMPKVLFYGNEQLLDQVWVNILDNAIKHSPAGAEIRISLHTTETSCVVTIADVGEGMTEDVQKHIFEKFYQGDSSRKAEGNGLGLALVKRIVDLCGGSIMVKSAPDCGTVLTVKLPEQR